MIRLYFTAADLRKITFAADLNALVEIALSVHRLHRWRAGGAQPRRGTLRWHRELGSSLEERAGVLFDLIPRRPGDWMPCFLFEPSISDLAEAVELVGQAPAAQVAADVSRLAPFQRSSRRVQALASGAAGSRKALADDLCTYFDSSLASSWSQIRATTVTDRALRSEILLQGGIDALFGTLGFGVRWEPPTLHIPAPFTADIHLEGRGLLLLSSYFTIASVGMDSPNWPPVLVYPMYLGGRPDDGTDALGPLLGRTRAAVLASLRMPATTTSLAGRAGVSVSSASQHTTALRNAGLISTIRRGLVVEHTLTPLGAALLHGNSM
ncbi:winged helix-turn-helix domain-containing protein [Actinomadura sp. DC4]|uniref:ArsR/SmtB family transcription factor n=1 Tax=Actinomadura sp. DC4 TaxID=3055069 RepID=UPI0025AFF0DB|nr:winged helix-turn-helix domain-containing protein [Actinomadura sp. DC4]